MHFPTKTVLLVFLLVDVYAFPYGHGHSEEDCWTQRCRPGHPCNIPGPRSLCDRIAIVGGGPAGIHMALLLKKRNFKNVRIFEKSNRIGGKSLTINYRDTPHDMGTVYLSPDYEQTITQLVEEYDAGPMVDLVPSTAWTNQTPTSFETYLITETIQFLQQGPNLQLALETLAGSLAKYLALHHDLFGDYEGELMPRPSDEVLKATEGTFADFLTRNGILALRPLFLITHTVQGYGHLDEIAAIYGLMWNTPRIVNVLIQRLQGNPRTGAYLLKNGFQPLWEKIACEENLDISYNSEITSVERSDRYGTTLTIKDSRVCGGEDRIEHFDFVMWTPELEQSLDAIDASSNERKLFKDMSPKYFSTSLLDSEGVSRGFTPIDYFFTEIEGRVDHKVWAQRDSFGALSMFGPPDYQTGNLQTGPDNSAQRTSVVYQMGDSKPTQRQLRKELKAHFNALSATDLDILETRIWRYFPRHKPEDITKLWDTLEYQGKENMWYIGSSVIFESTKSVAEYNTLLIDSMTPPSCKRRGCSGMSHWFKWHL